MNFNTSFIDQYIKGEVSEEDIHDFIDIWHEDDTTQTLFEFLGMTWDEYAMWVMGDCSLDVIILMRKGE